MRGRKAESQVREACRTSYKPMKRPDGVKVRLGEDKEQDGAGEGNLGLGGNQRRRKNLHWQCKDIRQ